MAASHYYQDHPYNRAPGPTYPPGGPSVNPASDSPSGVDAHHRRRRARDETRSYSAPKHSRRSGHRSSREDDYQRGRRHGDRDDYQRSYSSSSTSRSPPPKPRRRKSLGEQAMAALGLGGSSSHEGGHRRTRSRDRDYYDDRYHRDSDRERRRHRHRSRSYSRSPSPNRSSKDIRHVITAALTAGAAEAYRARKEPGGWTGEKGKRVLTAAIGAGGVDKLIERDPSKHTKRHILESTLAGLATTHLMKGGRSRSRSRHGRRVRSDSRGGMNNLAATGVWAAAGKKAYDHYRSRDRSPHSGYSSDESNQPHRRRKKRSQSMSDYVAKGLAALGLTDDVDDKRHSRRRHGRDRGSSDNDEYSDEYPPRRRERRSRRSR